MSVITIAGLIGVGKSTLIKNLCRLNNYTAFMEPTCESEGASNNPFLNAYYEDPKRWALAMQVNLLWDRYMQSQEAYFRSMHGETCLLDSSIYSDMAFALVQKRDGYFTDAEFNTYLKMHKHVSDTTAYPDLFVYLDIIPEKVVERIQKRARDCESGIPMDYLIHLQEAYQEVLESLKSKCRVERIDASQGRVAVMSDVDELISTLK